MKSDFLIALTQLASERHLPKEQVLQAIEVALASAFKKDNPAAGQNISVTLNPNTGDVSVYALKIVVESVEDPEREMTLEAAQAIKASVALGDEVASPEPLPHNASRIAAQTAKQVVLQRLREAERELIYEEFLHHKEDIISGTVGQMEPGRTIILDLGRAQGIMPLDEQVFTERYKKGQRVKVYVLDVRNGPKGPEILVSRSHRNMLKRLFEIEVPEVYNGVVEIKAIAREAGHRSKVAVYSTQDGIDPVGSCIGIRGNRIQSIVNELQGEKIDVVAWHDDPKTFIGRAISPSEVIHVELFAEEQTAMVVVPDRQLSLAIGKEGQNARLAARLSGWRLDIKGLTEWEEIREAHKQKKETEAAVAVLAQPETEAPEEVEAAVTALAETVTEVESQPAAVPEVILAEAGPVTAEKLDDEALLQALIQEEEETKVATAAEEGPGISVEELAGFTLDDVMETDVEEDEDEDEEEEDQDGAVIDPELLPAMPVLTPDAGKIRFAEDIAGEFRGGGRRAGRGRRAAKGGSRGGGGRR